MGAEIKICVAHCIGKLVDFEYKRNIIIFITTKLDNTASGEPSCYGLPSWSARKYFNKFIIFVEIRSVANARNIFQDNEFAVIVCMIYWSFSSSRKF